MENTRYLLMMVLDKIFQNQPKIIEETFQLIHNFNNGKTDKKNYEKTLKTICDLLCDKVPSPILVYILTLVDMPQNFDSSSSIIEKMKQTRDCQPDINVRPHLLEYLNNAKPGPSSKTQNDKPEISEKVDKPATNNFVKPTRGRKRGRKALLKVAKAPIGVKTLLDCCATYVIQNEAFLKRFYCKKQSDAWRLINANILSGTKLTQCYNVVKDLNKKMRWLREIESDNISTEMIKEEYNNSEIFLKEKHMYEALQRDPFVLSNECEAAIQSLFD